MNKRIQELRFQAWDYVASCDDQYSKSAADLFEEKFAELIVRECLETMRLVPYETDREFGDEVIYQDAVKKHFGVEE